MELSLALERERSLKSSRDGLALDQIRDRNTILELKEKVKKLERGNRPDHSWGSRTTNESQAISGDRSQARRDKPQSGGLSERAGSGSHSAPFLPRPSLAGTSHVAPVTVPQGIPAGAMDATSKLLVENMQLALNDVFSQLSAITARQVAVESGMSKEAHSGSGLDSRLVSPLSRLPTRGAPDVRTHAHGQPGCSKHRSSNLHVPDASPRENRVFHDLDSAGDSEDDFLIVHPDDNDLFDEEDE